MLSAVEDLIVEFYYANSLRIDLSFPLRCLCSFNFVIVTTTVTVGFVKKKKKMECNFWPNDNVLKQSDYYCLCDYPTPIPAFY